MLKFSAIKIFILSIVFYSCGTNLHSANLRDLGNMEMTYVLPLNVTNQQKVALMISPPKSFICAQPQLEAFINGHPSSKMKCNTLNC